VVSAAAIALALSWAGWQPLLEALRRASYAALAPAILLYLVSMAARALAWRAILGGRASLLRLLAGLNEGYLLNNLLPWRMGEFGRAVLVGRRPSLSPSMVLSSIVVERLLDMILAVGLLLSLGPMALRVSWAARAVMFGGVAVVVALAILLIVLLRPAVLDWLLARLPGGAVRWGGLGSGIRAGLTVLRTPTNLLRAFGWMAVSWGLAAIEYWVVLRGFVPGAPPTWALFTLCITLLGVAIPSGPGYFGVFEASAVAALSVFGVGSGSALAYALVLHALHFGITTLLGAIALAGEGESLGGVWQAARSWLLQTGPARAE